MWIVFLLFSSMNVLPQVLRCWLQDASTCNHNNRKTHFLMPFFPPDCHFANLKNSSREMYRLQKIQCTVLKPISCFCDHFHTSNAVLIAVCENNINVSRIETNLYLFPSYEITVSSHVENILHMTGMRSHVTVSSSSSCILHFPKYNFLPRVNVFLILNLKKINTPF